jgi:hypothetical protein
MSMKHELEKKLIARAEDQDLHTDEIFDTMQTQGVFVLISSRKIARNKLLPLYYTRDRVEKNSNYVSRTVRSFLSMSKLRLLSEGICC